MIIKMRPYQRVWCRAIVDAFAGEVNDTPFTKVLATAATGSGKSAMATAIMEHYVKRGEKCCFIADTDELCEQAVKTIYRFAGIVPDLEKASSRASRKADIVVASLQSLTGRLAQYDPAHFGLVIYDEAHGSMSEGSQKVLNHFHGGGAKICGITATAERGDKRSLMRYYEHLAAEIPMAELIRARHLSPITVMTVPLAIKIKSKITEGEQDDVAAELEAYYDAIIDSIEKHAADRKKFLWFHPSVAASKRFTALLMERGHSAAHVDGASPDRQSTIEGFHQSRFRHLNNVQVLTKGFDCPAIDCIVILRPTHSRTLYIQMAGRATRLFCPHGCTEWCDHTDRKADSLLIDYLWEFEGHDVMGPADLLTDAPVQREAVAKALREGKPLDLLQTDEFVTGQRESELLEKLKRQEGRRGKTIDAVTFAALLHQPSLLEYEPTAAWQEKPVSPAQAAFLTRAGVDPDSIASRGHASALGTTIFKRHEKNLATVNQLKWLVKFGIPSPHTVTFQEASIILDRKFKKT